MAENQQEKLSHEPVAGTSDEAASNQQEQQQRERRCSFCECFRMRAEQQQQDLRDLVNIRTHHIHNEQAIRRAIARTMQHYLDYSRMRAFIARSNAPAVCSPSCSSTFCNSFLWLGGCRPTVITRLVYVMAGQEVEGQLWELLQDVEVRNLAGLSAHQLERISNVQRATIRMEEALSKRMASLQEAMADQPLVGLARSMHGESSRTAVSGSPDSVMGAYSGRMAEIMADADKLRLQTLAKTIEILTITQALDLLITGAQLNICVLRQGKRRDRTHAS
ncbi:protein DOG1-like 3 [Nymphaea colorata]|uniref:DOG1 domain-containing protein n=1 Tax=Nymphaea colorata TaxID=210225 RepID=A0A5K0Z7Z3_9MAGN|nr:protein DOG1-like 3 [Nymphaea colorata]